MKNFFLLSLSVILINVSALAQTGSSDIQDIRDAYIEALKNSDTPGILKIYSDDVVIHHIDGTMLDGASEVGSFYDQFFEENKATISFENVSEDEIADNIMFYHDKVFLQMEGEDKIRNIEVVNIAEKVDGNWRVIKSYRWPMPE
ncbi:MAG: nuclear transport factor 2 family protein [Gramella sp.]|nr:nuclear transport factor 2 family protein [Christiangramia sp.]